MTEQFEWIIYDMSVVPVLDINSTTYENVVTEIKWILKISRDGVSIDTNGMVTLPKPSIPFSDFEMLTKQQVVDWVEEILGEEIITNTKNNLIDRLSAIINPKVIHKLPSSWNQPS